MSLAFHPRLPRVASTSDDHTVVVWDITTARSVHRWVADHGTKGLAFSPDGSSIACSAASYHKDPALVRLLDAETGAERKRLAGHRIDVRALAFDPKGERLVTGDDHGTVILWDVKSGRILRREVVGISTVSSVVFIDEGRRLLVALKQGGIALFDLERADPPRLVRLADGCGTLVADDRKDRATVGDLKGGLIALSLPDLEVIQRLPEGHGGAIVALASSPDGRLLVSSGMDRRVVLRDASTFRGSMTFPAWTGVVKGIAFDAKGRWVGFAGSDSDVCLWDLEMVLGELAPLGLSWDQDLPRATSSAESATIREPSSSRVPTIGVLGVASAESEAQRLLRSGVATSQQGRFADAVVSTWGRPASNSSRCERPAPTTRRWPLSMDSDSDGWRSPCGHRGGRSRPRLASGKASPPSSRSGPRTRPSLSTWHWLA